ncbi:alpha/beta hydrolase [Actinomadura macra]|uniref:alpha/beta hydrolase n=1 Tax=Actinomadura macra TaxID=46164 RepID=UPI000A614661|nr:alpha/beta hydrolase [Actinomadura macra]
MSRSVRDGVTVSTFEYAAPGGQHLLLDLYRPETAGHPAVTLYLHGGGWASGGRADHAEHRALALARRGIAVASLDYRLVPVARFPAQLEDARAALRWIRERGDDLALRVDRVGAWGASAGGHLAALLGMAPGTPREGRTSPEHADAVVAWAAPTDIAALARRSELETRVLPPSREAALLGMTEIDGADPRVREASPCRMVRVGSAPFLLVHGDRDRLIPPEQSAGLHRDLVAHGVESTLVLLGDAGHEDEAFHRPFVLDMVAAFLTTALGAPR